MLKLWEEVRQVPQNAQKKITGGRLRGMTDINPMWRIKALTEQFGPCGIGWKYEVTNKELIPGAQGEVAAIVDINLYIKHEGEWSEPIPGTGGSMFVAKEKAGLYTSDECYKMALTDAISVSCKALGFAADIYWQEGASKYSSAPEQKTKDTLTNDQLNRFGELIKTDPAPEEAKNRLRDLFQGMGYQKLSDVKQKDFQDLLSKYENYALPFEI